MRHLEIRHCRVLVAVHDGGGVGAAARLLGVAQSTVSETLLSLERVVGAQMTIRRPGRDAILTVIAQALLPHARNLIAAADTAMNAVMDRRTTVRLGTVESISSFLLPNPLRDVRRQWPDLDLSIVVGLCADLRQRVDSGELDAAITIDFALTDKQQVGRDVLAAVGLELIVSSAHPLIGRVVGRQQFRDQRFVLADASGAFIEVIEKWLGPVTSHAKLESAGSVDGVKRATADGAAIGILPRYAVEEEMRRGTLNCLTVGDAIPVASLCLATGVAPLAPAVSQLVAQVSRSICE